MLLVTIIPAQVTSGALPAATTKTGVTKATWIVSDAVHARGRAELLGVGVREGSVTWRAEIMRWWPIGGKGWEACGG